MKVVSIVGARPQFIKCAPVSRELRKVATEVLVQTGPHYDDHMSELFFRELEIPRPDYNLGVGSGSHHLSTLLFCPTEIAVKNLAQEGITKGARLVGHVMYDALLWHLSRMDGQAETLLAKLGVDSGAYALATVHRAESTDDLERLRLVEA